MRTLLKILFAALAIMLCVGCGEKDVKPTLVGSWQLEGYETLEGDFETPEYYWDSSYTVTFNANGTINGFASNNQSYGTFHFSADGAVQIKFQQMTDALELDGEKFLNAFNSTNSYVFKDQYLLLYYNSGQNFMRFKPWRRQDM